MIETRQEFYSLVSFSCEAVPSKSKFICFKTHFLREAETRALEWLDIYQMLTNKINIINHFDESEASENILMEVFSLSSDSNFVLLSSACPDFTRVFRM